MTQATQVPEQRRVGTVYWIDHFVCCTNDVDRWYVFNEKLLGAVSEHNDFVRRTGIGIFQDVGRSRIGGFICKEPLPPTYGIDAGLPRYGYYIDPSDVDAHVRRLEAVGAVHGAPVRTSALGEPGVSIPWQDPDGNQFEFWASDVMPEGAMNDCTSERVGRISHAVFESRDLERTAGLFARYCALDGEIRDDVLVLRLGAGARIVYLKTDALQGRTTGCGLPDAHTALLVHNDDYFPNYRKLWAELPEWDFDPIARKKIENPGSLPPRTVLHPSQGGRRFHALTQRGDDFFDWDTNMFHLYGGVPIGGSMAVYQGRSIEFYVNEWERTHGEAGSIKSVIDN